MFSLSHSANLRFRQYVPLSGNVLDVAILHEESAIIYSLDNYHEPFSIKRAAEPKTNLSRQMIGIIKFYQNDGWRAGDVPDNVIASIDRISKVEEPFNEQESERGRPLGELLYTIESLRKRNQADHI